jgi:hypothetical protein
MWLTPGRWRRRLWTSEKNSFLFLDRFYSGRRSRVRPETDVFFPFLVCLIAMPLAQSNAKHLRCRNLPISITILNETSYVIERSKLHPSPPLSVFVFVCLKRLYVDNLVSMWCMVERHNIQQNDTWPNGAQWGSTTHQMPAPFPGLSWSVLQYMVERHYFQLTDTLPNRARWTSITHQMPAPFPGLSWSVLFTFYVFIKNKLH